MEDRELSLLAAAACLERFAVALTLTLSLSRPGRGQDLSEVGFLPKEEQRRHSRARGNPDFFPWIPGLALLARNDGLLRIFGSV